MSETKLKPCPFCGKRLENIEKYRMLYQHPSNDCFFSELIVKQNEVEKWNTRKPMDNIVAELDKRKEESLQLWKKYHLTDDVGKMFAFDESIKIVKVGGKTEKVDCHYCQYAVCNDENSSVDCYVEDFAYFDHHVTDSKEAEECAWFEFCGIFPKC